MSRASVKAAEKMLGLSKKQKRSEAARKGWESRRGRLGMEHFPSLIGSVAPKLPANGPAKPFSGSDEAARQHTVDWLVRAKELDPGWQDGPPSLRAGNAWEPRPVPGTPKGERLCADNCPLWGTDHHGDARHIPKYPMEALSDQPEDSDHRHRDGSGSGGRMVAVERERPAGPAAGSDEGNIFRRKVAR